MKVYIGPYKHWRSPHAIAEKIIFWEKYDRFSDDPTPKAIEWADDFLTEHIWIVKAINWCMGYYMPRRSKIIVDEYDVWGADHTLSQIIYPVLLKLKEVKHGSPCIDNEDVPEHLRSRPLSPADADAGVDDNLLHARWDWALDEMIWAHHSIINEGAEEDSWYDPLPPGTPVRKTGRVENEDGSVTWKLGNEHGIFNTKKRDAFLARQKHGLYLFGKYYRGLWD